MNKKNYLKEKNKKELKRQKRKYKYCYWILRKDRKTWINLNNMISAQILLLMDKLSASLIKKAIKKRLTM